jgi:hypothetical protein
MKRIKNWKIKGKKCKKDEKNNKEHKKWRKAIDMI